MACNQYVLLSTLIPNPAGSVFSDLCMVFYGDLFMFGDKPVAAVSLDDGVDFKHSL